MDILSLEILFAIVSCMVYSYAMLTYAGSIIGFRSQLLKCIGSFTVCFASAIYTCLTLFHVPIPVIYIMAFFIILTLFRIFLNGSWLQYVFAAGNFIFHIVSFRGVTLAILSLTTGESLYTIANSKPMSSLSLGLTFTSSFIYLSFFFSRLYPLKNIIGVAQEPKYLKIMSYSQSILNILLILGSTVYYLEDIDTWFSYYHLVAYILIFIVFYILFNFCVKSTHLQEFQSAYNLYEQQLEKQVDAYTIQGQYIQHMRKFRHDWINLKSTLVPMIDTGSKEELLSFLGQFDTALHSLSDTYKEFSNYPLVQAILIHTQALCQKYGINFEATAIFPKEIPLSILNLCRIFTNITNNAVEANNLLDKSATKFIHITTAANRNWCTITCENSFNGVIQKSGDVIFSTKKNPYAHGFGIRNVEDIMESCGGFVQIDTNPSNKIFKILIHIPSISSMRG